MGISALMKMGADYPVDSINEQNPLDASVHQHDECSVASCGLVVCAIAHRLRKSLGFKCLTELFLPDIFIDDDYYHQLVELYT